MMSMSNSFATDSNLNDFFSIIQAPIYNSVSKRDLSNAEIINCIDLNMLNFKKYFPIISSILKNNDYYKYDLLYDFLEVRSMSIHILDTLENLTNQVFLELNPFLDKIYDSLLFVDIILDDFRQILQRKNDCVNSNISNEEYDLAYVQYKLKLDQNMKLFYEKYFNDDVIDNDKEFVKEIMSMELIENEFK